MNSGKPAFSEWSKKLSVGEKLPRGKFFQKEEVRRNFMSAFLCQSMNSYNNSFHVWSDAEKSLLLQGSKIATITQDYKQLSNHSALLHE